MTPDQPGIIMPPSATFNDISRSLLVLSYVITCGGASTDSYSAVMNEKLGEAVVAVDESAVPQQIRSWDTFRVPPPDASPSWSLCDFRGGASVATGLRYDDNLTQDDEQTYQDSVIVLRPESWLRWEPINLPSGSGARGRYTPEVETYVENSRFNAVNHQGGLQFELPLGRTRIEATYEAALSREPELMRTGRGQRHREEADLSMFRELGAKTRFLSALGFDYSNVEDGIESTEFRSTLALDRLVTEKTMGGFGYRLRSIEVNSSADSFIQEPHVRLQHVVTDRLDARLAMGGCFLVPTHAPEAEAMVGPTARGEIVFQLSEKGEVAGKFVHDERPSYYTEGQLDRLTQGGIRASYRLTERVKLAVQGVLGHNDQTSWDDSNGSAGAYSYWALDWLLDYAITEHLHGTFSYRHSQRDSNRVTSSFSRNRVELELEYRL